MVVQHIGCTLAGHCLPVAVACKSCLGIAVQGGLGNAAGIAARGAPLAEVLRSMPMVLRHTTAPAVDAIQLHRIWTDPTTPETHSHSLH